MTHELTFVIKCGTLTESELASIPTLLATNPFGSCSLLLDDSDGANYAEQPYSDAALLTILHGAKEWNLTLVERTRGWRMSIDLVRYPRGTMVSIMVEHERLVVEYEQFLAYTRRWLDALPGVTSGNVVGPISGLAALHQQYGLERPPACFTTDLRWVHFLAPSYYTLFLSTEDLLATPAYHVEQTDTLVIVRNYANPFEGYTPATLQQLAAITHHLRAKNYFPHGPLR